MLASCVLADVLAQEGQHAVEHLIDSRVGHPSAIESVPVALQREQLVLTADPDKGSVTVAGKTLQLDLPAPAPHPSLNFEFARDAEGWRTTRGILTAESRDGLLALKLAAPGAYMHSPLLSVPAEAVTAIEIRMRIRAEGAKPGGLYFTTDEHPNIWNDKLINFEVKPDGEWHTYRLNVSSNPRWKGTVTGLRLDPLRGATEAEVEIDWVRGAP